MNMNFQFPLFDYFGRYIINTNLFFFFLADKFTYTEAQKIMMHQKKGGGGWKKKKKKELCLGHFFFVWKH